MRSKFNKKDVIGIAKVDIKAGEDIFIPLGQPYGFLINDKIAFLESVTLEDLFLPAKDEVHRG